MSNIKIDEPKSEAAQGKREFKGCLHSFPKTMVKICFAIDVGLPVKEITDKISAESVRKAVNYYRKSR